MRGGNVAKGNRGGRGRQNISSATGSLTLGNEKIEFDGQLDYTINDPAVNAKQRAVLDVWEKKREKQKIEYANAVGYNGSEYGEVKGGKGSVRVPHFYHSNKGSAFTHIHPRGNGELGGTFSIGDMQNFVNGQNQTARAVAKEGTYSISRGKNFNGGGFISYYRSEYNKLDKVYSAKCRQLRNDVVNKKISYSTFSSESTKAFNTFLVSLSNALSKGQQTYGYHYYLEKR